MVSLTIDDKKITVEEGLTIIQAAKRVNIEIPSLCYIEGVESIASCRICAVEVEGRPNLVASCATPVSEGMVVKTNSQRIYDARRTVLDLVLSTHPLDCLTCEKAGNCKLQDYCYEYDVKVSSYIGKKNDYPIDDTNPFYYFDKNKCILCRRCVKVCSELQCNNTLCFSERGFVTHVSTPFEGKLGESNCVSCGNCVSVCPVGALMPKSRVKFRTWETRQVKTVCSFCGVGCEMYLKIKGDRIVGVAPAMGPANKGLLCVKGKFAYGFVNHPDRLKKPLVKKDGVFEEATWDEVLDIIADRISGIRQKYGPQSLAGLSSAKCTNEENYLFQKLFRAVIGTNNVDHCARLCHASTVAGLAATLGSGAMTNSIEETLNSDVIFVTGSNTTEAHPVIGAQIRQARLKGARIIVADPRRIELSKDAEIYLQIKPGTNVALFNGMMNVIIEEGLQDKEYIEARTEGYEGLADTVRSYTPERVGEICGVDPDDIRKAARLYGKADRAGIFYSMGVTQHSTGTQGVMSVSNLALLCGNIGKESAGVNPLRGQNNVQGACDMGSLPGDLPGYQKVFNPQALEKFEAAWGVKLPDKAGVTVTEMLAGAEKGNIRFMYIMGENPMISDPDINHVEKSLKALDFLVVQDIFLTETARLADIVLPASAFAEKDGTFTNTERRVQRVRKALEPPGEAKADWQILMELMKKLGYEKTYGGPSEIMDEIAGLTPSYGGISYDRLEAGGIQWPCPTRDHPGTKYLHKESFTRGKGLFKQIDYVESAELPDSEYPYLLTTGRVLYHYHTRTMTGRIEGLNRISPESFAQINPVTANRLQLSDGSRIKVSSRRGEIFTKVRVTDVVEEDVVFIPFHFADGAANYLTNSATDPIAGIPEFKVCAIKIEKAD
ncbi:MAG: formate dehydrogenase subunit alpha [Ruminiclostridium sp.]|nr:formate dehydrogenase subunit alpha [Ruminiclostridium sp.]